MNTVPFELGEVYQGFASGNGLMRAEDQHLCLEFQVQGSLVGLIKSGITQLRIPIADLASVTLEKRWFGLCTNMVIQVARMEAVKDFPGMTQGRLVLGIARRERPGAAKLIADLQFPDRK
jgi:hypothetical protein